MASLGDSSPRCPFRLCARDERDAGPPIGDYHRELLLSLRPAVSPSEKRVPGNKFLEGLFTRAAPLCPVRLFFAARSALFLISRRIRATNESRPSGSRRGGTRKKRGRPSVTAQLAPPRELPSIFSGDRFTRRSRDVIQSCGGQLLSARGLSITRGQWYARADRVRALAHETTPTVHAFDRHPSQRLSSLQLNELRAADDAGNECSPCRSRTKTGETFSPLAEFLSLSLSLALSIQSLSLCSASFTFRDTPRTAARRWPRRGGRSHRRTLGVALDWVAPGKASSARPRRRCPGGSGNDSPDFPPRLQLNLPVSRLSSSSLFFTRLRLRPSLPRRAPRLG